MKALKNKKAFTLIEVLLAIAIIAAVALPLLSVFLQSVKTDQAAKDVLNSNYIAQDYVENLDAQTYPSALATLPDHQEINHYFLSATIEPYGSFGDYGYVHLIMYDNGTMLTVFPDGKWHQFSAVPSQINLSLSAGVYTFSAGGISITGPSGSVSCALLINAMQKPSETTTAVSLGAGCKAFLYCQRNHEDDLAITGDNEVFEGILNGNTSLIHVSTYIFDSQNASEPIAMSESYKNIRNWS